MSYQLTIEVINMANKNRILSQEKKILYEKKTLYEKDSKEKNFYICWYSFVSFGDSIILFGKFTICFADFTNFSKAVKEMEVENREELVVPFGVN